MSGVEFLPADTAVPVAPVARFPADELGTPPPAPTTGGSSVRRGRRLWPRSLTSRLVTGAVLLVFVIVTAIGSITYVALRSTLDDRLNQQVDSTAGRNANFFDRCEPVAGSSELECPLWTGPSQSMPEWIALLNSDGSVAGQVTEGPLRVLRLSAAQRHELAAHPGRVINVHQDGYDLRVSASAPRQPDSSLVVVTGLSTQDRDGTLGNLLTVEVSIGLGAIALAFLSTLFGVRRSLRNLYRVTGTAQEVSAELSPTGAGLERRVPVTDEGSEVGQLAQSFNTMLAAVETQFAARLESEQRLRQFLADASHELRTPLTSIRGYAELARMQRAAGVAADGPDDNLDRIESEGTRMSRLVDDLLLLARGDADNADGAERPAAHEPVDVPELLDDIVRGSRAAFPDRPIELRVEPVPHVLGDRDQLLRAIRNLVTNAAVHTDPNRPIQVGARTQAGGVVITVVDGGPGLPPEQAAHVFERFWRADKARTRARGGTGLGMAIVASIVRAHGGSVRFDSSVEHGSTVTVWLPAGD